ncbi:hypothetical protein NW762_003442 [Fusarium torreyae]|uniref:F-box domain-containing protein n=1 Tax=Fusarium torreyae TaxID=1237075 RepID=A0A9W8SAB6_9HYPO|nr:hypothetical protein NW762_003442 [Fusarium torreyae]
MKTRSMKRAEAKTWSSLPSEIRLMILEKITCQKFPRWAYLTSVSREWQQVLEKVNFSKIKLELSCLDAFVRIVVEQRRMLVRHICLNLELPKYRPITSSTYVSRSEDDVANIQEVIWQFWRILSDWEPAGNLTLELNMYSPSDRQYWFKNIYLFSDEVEDVEDPVPDAWRVGTPPHDPKYGWVRGQQVRNPPATAKVRLFRLLKLTFDKPLPKVPAVTRFVMRRQLRRFVSPTVLGPLLSTFDHLEHISYEPWMTYPYIYYNGDRSKELYSKYTQNVNNLRGRVQILRFISNTLVHRTLAESFPAEPWSTSLGPKFEPASPVDLAEA